MQKVSISFKDYVGGHRNLVGYQCINGDLFFGINMGENFRRNPDTEHMDTEQILIYW